MRRVHARIRKSGGKLSFRKTIPDLMRIISHIERRRSIGPGYHRPRAVPGASIAAELAAAVGLKGLIVESGLATLNGLIGSTLKNEDFLSLCISEYGEAEKRQVQYL